MLPSWYIPHGGKFVRNQVQTLQEQGLNVNILANNALSMKLDKSKFLTYPWKSYVSMEDDILVYRYFQRNFPKLTKVNAMRWINQTIQLFEKYQKIYGKPNIIHAHTALWAGYTACLIKQKYNIPYIITEHYSNLSLTCDYAKKTIKQWHTIYYETAFSNANHIVPVSNIIQPKIESFLKQQVPITPISNVLNTDYFHFKERKVGETIKFVATNGFYYQKGYDILIPAFDNACEVNTNLEITIVGENFDTKGFEEIWNRVKHKNKFHFTGELTSDGVRNELWNANIFIIPSRVESQSVSTLEALSTGLPIIATTTIPTIMTTAENSIVVPVEDIEAMTVAILQMSKNFQNYDGKYISKHIKSIAGKDSFTKEILTVYKQVLGE